VEVGFGSCVELHDKVFICRSYSFSGDGSLSTRAWCYQKELLAVRSVSFGSNQIAGKCGATSTSLESYPAFTSKSRGSDKGYVRHDAFLAERSEAEFLSEYNQCYAIVTAYSVRNITFFSDRLSALMGIAQSQRLSTKNSYIAGLWKKDLVYGLLWKSRKWKSTIGYTEPRRHKPPGNYQAHSWSRASLLNSTIIFEPRDASRNLTKASVTLEVESQTHIDGSDAVEADSEDADDRESDEGDIRLENYGLLLLRHRPGSYELCCGF